MKANAGNRRRGRAAQRGLCSFGAARALLLLVGIGGCGSGASPTDELADSTHRGGPERARGQVAVDQPADHRDSHGDEADHGNPLQAPDVGDSEAVAAPAPAEAGEDPQVDNVAPQDAAETMDDEGAAGASADDEAIGAEVPGRDTSDSPRDLPIPVAFAGELRDWCRDQSDNFSAFTTSREALWTLAGSDLDEVSGGFGGDLGGLEGADAICQTIGRAAGHGHKAWRAFLSAADDGTGNPVHAIERIGTGPWHNSRGELVAPDLAGLVTDVNGSRSPVALLLDECGGATPAINDVVTGSDIEGRLAIDPISTCGDWTSTEVPGVDQQPGPMGGHQRPVGNLNWLSAHPLRGCGKGWNDAGGPSTGQGDCLGCSGGYGGIYCFAQEAAAIE